ncbi:MAG: hypothetical protein OXQ89_08280 [Rhodospirillaceae bacterium]|nr:hypothetical protein [Rhodospirillaceae bacterium]
MRHGVIPRQLHFESPNPHVEWDKLPVRVTSEPTAWPPADDRPPTAGVSAFGISGTNAHLLVEGYRAPEGDAGPKSRGTRFLPLSGKSDQALKDLADRYLSWLDEQAEEIASDGDAESSLLADMAWTASMGRSHFEHRAGVIFTDIASLREELANVAREGGTPGPQSMDEPGVETIAEVGPEAAVVQAAARAYEAGDELDFQGLFAGETRRRISLPGYPFQRRPFWFDGSRKPTP